MSVEDSCEDCGGGEGGNDDDDDDGGGGSDEGGKLTLDIFQIYNCMCIEHMFINIKIRGRENLIFPQLQWKTTYFFIDIWEVFSSNS